jgi:peptidoglycan hydrolase-like protein with peptidoglycan-binding domain
VALVLVLAVVVVVVTDPFGGLGKSSHSVATNASATSLATVTQRPLSSQTQVNGTLGYANSSNVRLPAGTAPAAVQQAQQSVANAEATLQKATASLSADGQGLEEAQASASAAREKESVDCRGDGAAETGPCASDKQAVSTAQQSVTSAAAKITTDRSSVTSAKSALASAQASLSAARSSVVYYAQNAIFTSLPTLGQVLARGQTLYQISDEPVVLLYGSLVASRAFLTGMPPGRDVAALNTNLEKLGYGQGLTGETFTTSTAAAIRTFQSAHGMTATGQLPLGSVVFEPGPVRVTSVTAQVGASVAPGPVLGITSTARQVKIELDAAEQSSVKVGDAVTITMPDNQTTPGKISHVATVATSPASKGGEEGTPTIEVDAIPANPAATGDLDEAPVEVSVTNASVNMALVVPVDALLALAGGGYAIEAVEVNGTHRLISVTLGLFDDADGLVQVSGSGLRAGQHVVVPAT